MEEKGRWDCPEVETESREVGEDLKNYPRVLNRKLRRAMRARATKYRGKNPSCLYKYRPFSQSVVAQSVSGLSTCIHATSQWGYGTFIDCAGNGSFDHGP